MEIGIGDIVKRDPSYTDNACWNGRIKHIRETEFEVLNIYEGSSDEYLELNIVGKGWIKEAFIVVRKRQSKLLRLWKR